MNDRIARPLLADEPDREQFTAGAALGTAIASVGESPAAMFERLASNPDASVEKIERLMALWERTEARKAEAAFNAAMAEAQKAMKPVAADADNPQTRSRYASYEALDKSLRPIYTKHGFALSFNTGDAPQAEYVRVLCKVSHLAGHSETYKADMPADGKGAKGGDVMTKTHAVGSAMSYGMRYLLKMIFNVAVGEEDDDGNKASGKQGPTAPDGYDAWLSSLQEAAITGGFPAFEKMWAEPQTADFRKFLASTAPKMLANIKTKAREVRAK